MQNNQLGLINFEVKTSTSEPFFKINSVLNVQFLGDTVNMVSRRALERHV